MNLILKVLVLQILEQNKSDIKNVFKIQKCPKIEDSKQPKNRSTKYPKRLNLSSRSDVLNKSSIRKLRRHFWALFKNNSNPRTFWSGKLPFARVLKTMKTILIKTYDKEIFDDDMCMFIIGIAKLTQIKNLEINHQIKYNVHEFFEWWNRYSKEKFIRLIQNKYVKQLWILCGDENMKRQLYLHSKSSKNE